MIELTGWVLIILTSPRSGKRRLYVSGIWPDGKVKTSSAIYAVLDNGVVQTISGSKYALTPGKHRFGKTLEEDLAACGEWVPAEGPIVVA